MMRASSFRCSRRISVLPQAPLLSVCSYVMHPYADAGKMSIRLFRFLCLSDHLLETGNCIGQ
jgi:hypothetical protein